MNATAAGAVAVTAKAQGGGGGNTSGQAASATATGAGASGTFSATAAASGFDLPVSASTSGAVNGVSTGVAKASFESDSWAFNNSAQGVALITTNPLSTSVNAVLAANPTISSVLSELSGGFVSAIGELGGRHSSAGAQSQVQTSTINATVELDGLAGAGLKEELVAGLYNGAAAASGFTSMTFDVFAGSAHVLHKVFTSAAAAKAYFTDDVIDLESFPGPQIGGPLQVKAVMTVTGAAPGTGFYGGLVFGEQLQNAPAAQRFAQAVAGFGARGGDVGSMPAHTPGAQTMMLTSGRHALMA